MVGSVVVRMSGGLYFSDNDQLALSHPPRPEHYRFIIDTVSPNHVACPIYNLPRYVGSISHRYIDTVVIYG